MSTLKQAGEIAIQYKRSVTQSFISLRPDQIDSIAGNTFYVSRKYDGMLAVLVMAEGSVAVVNSNGIAVKSTLPCFEEAAALLAKSGLKDAVIAGELYADETNGRARVFDTSKAVADEKLNPTLRFAPFDIVLIEDKPYKPASWAETIAKLDGIFGSGKTCAPVRMEKASNKEGVKKLFAEWVEKEGAEGIVVRSELPLVYKVKPKYSIDAVVIGFSIGAKGTVSGVGPDEVRALLLALIDEKGDYQIIGKAGSGIGPEERKPLCQKLLTMKTNSNFIETDTNHVAFHMVRPELVVEISANDALFENSTGPIINQCLSFDENGYRRLRSVPGISLISPIFERFRDDKKANSADVRLAQISEVFYNPFADAKGDTGELPKSELLKREVYKKEAGSKLMVQKFLLWKTNKEKLNPSYSAFVLSYTNFSSERAEPLQTEMRISNDEEQINALFAEFMEKNIKKGWEKAVV
jgi:ATP-dependent DNA ligase